MTVTDCHRKEGSSGNGHAKKIFAFWERFANDRHRPTFDLHQKDAKKPEKLGKCRSMYLIYILYAREKKSKNFFYIERYGNDLHRPTSFLFHRLEERSFSYTKQKHLQLLLYVNRHLPQAFSFIFVGLPRSKKRPSPTVTKKVQKSPKNWEVTVGDTHMYTLRTREKK